MFRMKGVIVSCLTRKYKTQQEALSEYLFELTYKFFYYCREICQLIWGTKVQKLTADGRDMLILNKWARSREGHPTIRPFSVSGLSTICTLKVVRMP